MSILITFLSLCSKTNGAKRACAMHVDADTVQTFCAQPKQVYISGDRTAVPHAVRNKHGERERETALSSRRLRKQLYEDELKLESVFTPQSTLSLEHNLTIKTYMAIMAERDAAIRDRNMALDERRRAIAERDMAMLQRDAAIAERNK
ncbi:hypothetical protein CsSME_00003301 [Camellia sinensis var. sinensis]